MLPVQALTLVASFLLFPKHLGWGHPIGAALVLGSVFVVQKKPKPKRDLILPHHRSESERVL
jgi:drug/metabolite transporter (DMT)-like permease